MADRLPALTLESWMIAAGISAVAVPAALVSHWLMRRAGRRGLVERAVGEFLVGLERTGSRVLHDIEYPGGHIDHIVLHRSGVYVIETMTLPRTNGEQAMPVQYVDGVLRLAGRILKTDALDNASSSAGFVSGIIAELGAKVPVRSIVLCTGRPVVSRRALNDDPLVLSTRALPKHLARRERQLSDPEIVTLHREIRARIER